MTAPLYLLRAGALDDVSAGAEVELDGVEARHAVTVRRTRVGERIDLADGHGLRARCVVTLAEAVARRPRLRATVEQVDRAPAPWPRLVLVQALAKGGRDELAVETATELGVDAVLPWQSARSVVVWSGERGLRSRDRWLATARAAAKQSRRAVVPVVETAHDTTELARRVAATLSTGGQALILHEDAELPLVSAFLPAPGRQGEVLVIVGPEGGITGEDVMHSTDR